MKRYKFQALVTLGPAPDGGLAAMNSGQMRRVVVRGHHHDTGGSKFFGALVTKQGGDGGRGSPDHLPAVPRPDPPRVSPLPGQARPPQPVSRCAVNS